jgi:RNA polymerase sigma-70 factor (ECF subfamily)
MGESQPDSGSLQALMSRMRPRLHRYCARMIGSAIDGEDVVQEALAKAIEAQAQFSSLTHPESWLFRIAHNTALDTLRQRSRATARSAEADLHEIADPGASADTLTTTDASLAALMQLPGSQRSCVVLMDVLEHSLAETAEILGVSVASVKAALHRGRSHLKRIAVSEAGPPPLAPAEQQLMRSYAERFNARDFDALRSLLAEDSRLDLVGRIRLAGRKDVSVYFARYAESADWYFTPGVIEGRPGLLVSDPADPTRATRYVVLLEWQNGRIASIRDFRYAPYVMESLALHR